MTHAAQWLSSAPIDRLIHNAKSTGLFSPDPNAGPLFVARAPGRLDVMGGIADYTGSLVCEMPLASAAGVLVQARTDGQIVCHSRQTRRTFILPTSVLALKDPTHLRNIVSKDALYLIGCAWYLSSLDPRHGTKGTGPFLNGATILLDSDVPLGGGVSSSAAIEVATMTALARLAGITLSPLQLAVACQQVENRAVGAPCGVMDQVTCSMGKTNAMLEILCQTGPDGLPAQVLGTVAVPDGFAFIGIHSGVSHEVSGDPYTDTRVAAFIAQRILQVDHDIKPLGHHLANIDAAYYTSTLREKLPEFITGQAFLNRYGHTNDPITHVKPDTNYHARAAADHHILEAARVRQFVDLLKQASANPAHSDPFVQKAGQLMYESHASYSDCAKMGHPLTDQLADASHKLGPRSGFYGAKITGGGCGGTVAFLIQNTQQVRQRVQTLIDEYVQRNNRQTLLITGSGPGAAELGAHQLAYTDLP
jgi:galactokinase